MNCEIQLPAQLVRVRAGQLDESGDAALTAGHYPKDSEPFKITAHLRVGDFFVEVGMTADTARQVFNFLSTQFSAHE